LEKWRVDILGVGLPVEVRPSVRLLEQRKGALKRKISADMLARLDVVDLPQPGVAVLGAEQVLVCSIHLRSMVGDIS